MRSSTPISSRQSSEGQVSCPAGQASGWAFQDEGDADEDDSGEAEDIQYKDFFDPAEAPAEQRGLPHSSGSNAARCRANQRDSHLGFKLIQPVLCGRGMVFSSQLM